MKQNDSVSDLRAPWLATFALLTAVAAIFVVASQALAFNHDEIEHVHAAWHVAAGRIPYRDFFENHQPLFWYLLAPALGPASWPNDILDLRAALLVCAFAIAAGTFRLAVAATSSRRVAWTAVVLLTTFTTFARAAIEIRPDVPSAVASTFGCAFFISAFRSRSTRVLALSGVALAVGLLFNQKAIGVLGALSVIGIYSHRRLGIVRVGWLIAPSIVALVVMAAWLALTGSLGEYWTMAWMFPSLTARGSTHHGYGQFEASLTQNAPFWLAAVAGMVSAWRQPGPDGSLRPLTVATLLLLASFFAAERLFNQYLLPACPLLAVLAAVALVRWAERSQAAPRRRLLAATGLVVVVPLVILLSWTRPTNGDQIERMAFVTAITPRDGAVYDGDNRLNPFRGDVHHLWFMIGREPETSTYNRVAGPGRVPYDTCAVIRRREPTVISDFQLDLRRCGLMGRYRAVLPGIYLLVSSATIAAER